MVLRVVSEMLLLWIIDSFEYSNEHNADYEGLYMYVCVSPLFGSRLQIIGLHGHRAHSDWRVLQ